MQAQQRFVRVPSPVIALAGAVLTAMVLAAIAVHIDDPSPARGSEQTPTMSVSSAPWQPADAQDRNAGGSQSQPRQPADAQDRNAAVSAR